ncbi:hypothetical protein ccbrp13_71000 [Ktedonobacteria bacterium brp13]|nr:hypothetical protein ccbrp13_71000 [Ktedonobacteria bacterium brp13]
MTESSRIYQDIFYMDGSLRDIYVLRTSEQDWQTLLDFLRTSSYPLECLVGGEHQPLPEQVTDLFKLEREVGVTLRIDREHLEINCHFFTHEEIEFDLDPKDFQNDQQVSRLLDFIRAIGQLLNVFDTKQPAHPHIK